MPYGLDLWHEANGLSILLEWVTSLPAKLGSNVVENLLIEPLVKVFLAITHYVIVNDLKSRHYFYLNQSVFFKSLLQGTLAQFSILPIRNLCLIFHFIRFSGTLLLEGLEDSPKCISYHSSDHLYSCNTNLR